MTMSTYTPGRASQQAHDLFVALKHLLLEAAIEPGTFIDDDDGAEVSVYTLTVDSLELGRHKLHLAINESDERVIGVVNLGRIASEREV
jgi:hypothetical protein